MKTFGESVCSLCVKKCMAETKPSEPAKEIDFYRQNDFVATSVGYHAYTAYASLSMSMSSNVLLY